MCVRASARGKEGPLDRLAFFFFFFVKTPFLKSS